MERRRSFLQEEQDEQQWELGEGVSFRELNLPFGGGVCIRRAFKTGCWWHRI